MNTTTSVTWRATFAPQVPLQPLLHSEFRGQSYALQGPPPAAVNSIWQWRALKSITKWFSITSAETYYVMHVTSEDSAARITNILCCSSVTYTYSRNFPRNVLPKIPTSKLKLGTSVIIEFIIKNVHIGPSQGLVRFMGITYMVWPLMMQNYWLFFIIASTILILLKNILFIIIIY